jgi:BTB/POZ domain
MPKRKRESITDSAPAFPPQLHRRCLGHPDLEVVVGGTSFMHHSFILCYSSEYFDTMLASGMQESQTKKIEFPDKNPDEWKLFYPFLEPRSVSTADSVKITKENAKAILPWFHEFGMTKLLNESDEKLWSSLLLFKHSYYPSDYRTLDQRKTALLEIVGWTQTADTYGLPRTRDAMMQELQKAVMEYPELFNKEILTNMMPLWSKEHDIQLWEAVKSRLPSHVRENNDDNSLRSNALFLDFLTQSFTLAALQKEQVRMDEGTLENSDSDDDMPELARRRNVLAGLGRLREFRQRLNAAREEVDDIRVTTSTSRSSGG